MRIVKRVLSEHRATPLSNNLHFELLGRPR
jgi:hypothetical protein